MTTVRPAFHWTISGFGAMTLPLPGFQSREPLERRKEILQPTVVTQQPIHDLAPSPDDLNRQLDDGVQKPPKFHPHQCQTPVSIRYQQAPSIPPGSITTSISKM